MIASPTVLVPMLEWGSAGPLNDPSFWATTAILKLAPVGKSLAAIWPALSPAYVAWTAAQELETHGHDDAAADARRAGLAWSTRRDAATRADRLLEARLLLELGGLEAARQCLDALGPVEDVEALGLAALLAAEAGDTTSAHELLSGLENLRRPYLSGRHLLLAAGVRAALDQPQLAVDTLRRALAAGLPFSAELHALPMLRPLQARADFVTLLRPRG